MIITAFTSDPHYAHKNIIQHANRPFVSVEEMNSELIRRYNEKISDDDTVLWVGDAFFCNVEKAKKIMAQLNGRKMIVIGNHDRSMGSMAGIGFDVVMEECMLQISGKPVRIKHYPYAGNKTSEGGLENRYLDRRPPKIKGEILIHGHTHSKVKVNGTMVHVGVDAHDFYPVMISDVEKIINEI